MDEGMPAWQSAHSQNDAAGKAAPRDLIVAGVGASAGGLEAFSDLLRFLPPTTGMAFVLVQHLDPHHQSMLPDLLAAKTRMPVLQVHDGTRIEPDHVYVIPPNAQMRIQDYVLVLSSRPSAVQETFKPVDVFFNSLADELHFNAIGIVLSGTASDGTLGLKNIKAAGGITFAQNQTAKFDSMPRSAIAAGAVDFVLSPRRIAEELMAIARRTVQLTPPEEVLAGDGTSLSRLLLLLRKSTGVDFAQYKQPTILRRLNRRMVLRKVDSLDQYLEFLQKESTEIKALFDDLLINVTDFFRDPEVFETAKRVAFASLVRDAKQAGTIRAWIPGCSTGEEVYSMMIALVEFLESEDLPHRIQMFGTDLSDATIDKARAGIYSESAVTHVSPERLRRFFQRADSGYQISRTIRDMCIFSRHNVAQDPPLSRMDLISCRNLLIYFAPTLQRRVLTTFGYALQPGGCLILGPSESLGSLSEYFQTLDEPHKIYCRKANAAQNIFQLPAPDSEYTHANLLPPAPAFAPSEWRDARPGDFGQAVLSRHGPAAMVVDETLQITELRGDVTKYLGTLEVKPHADLMAVLHPDLRAVTSTAIEQARRTETAVLAGNIALPGEDRPGDITVVPLSLAGIPPHFLILIGRGTYDVEPEPSEFTVPSSPPANPLPPDVENAHLKQELKSTREYLQALIEELRSANEEAQSANEELQSTNEEMQTSKEELQSSNEELNTINTEMQSRNLELKQINDDLLNLLGSMNMPIVMTGRDLRIRRFTPSAESVLRLISTDVGRPIADLKPRINVPDLDDVLRRVLDSLQPYEQEVQDQEGRSYLLRVRPYQTADNRIDGAVLQLLEVTDLKRSLEEVKHARDYAEMIINTVREPLAVLAEDGAIQNANPAFLNIVELPRTDVLGKHLFEVAHRRFDLPPLRALIKSLKSGAAEISDVEIEYDQERYGARTLVANASRVRWLDQKQLILIVFEDVTERKRTAEARYRRLFESARDGILLVDAVSGEILDLNPFAERLLGYRREELVGGKLWDIQPMQPVPHIRAAVEQIRERGDLRFDDSVLRTKEGRDIHVEMIASVYADGDRRAIQFNMRDITERKRFERELQETQKLESLGLLAGGIAHDFNNLLTGILGNASLAFLETSADEPARARLRQIVDACERAGFLTRQLLAYAGKGRFVVSKIDLGDFVQEISTLVRTSIPRTIDLRLERAPNLPPIEADTVQIQQVVMNLVINGAEAVGESTPGRVTIRTSVREIGEQDAAEFFQADPAAPGTYVQLEVTDTGQGMDEATKARIFDPFFTTKFTGRGLGLAAVLGIIRAHHGALSVYSRPGKGSTFLILLPASGGHAAGPAAVAPDSTLTIPAGSVALVIEDEVSIRMLAENVLTRAGIRVLLAKNGKNGVEMFREHNQEISVVLLDLQMPVMGGEEALALLRQIDPDIPIILSSGFDESEAERRFAALKPGHFLQKPYTAARLADAVAAALSPQDAN